MLVHWIWLAHRPKLSDWSKRMLLEHFRDPEEIYYADAATLGQCVELNAEGTESLKDKDLASCQEILEQCSRLNLHILTMQDAAYPGKLKNISDPPLVLYYKGQLPQFDENPVIGVVGTRKASAYGLTAAKRMGYQIAKCGGIVVSGMAYGIDGMAMSGALTAGKETVGVLGCGADIVYPVSNRNLFRDVERYGCIISEFAPGTPPAKWNFPKRNRIISGLSNGVLVVEAPEKSGALITANLALEQGRDVFVVPGNIDQPGFVGSNRLLRDGGTVVSSGWDILSEYEALYPGKIREDGDPCHITVDLQEAEKVAAQQEKPQPKVAQKPKLPGNKRDVQKDFKKKAIDKSSSGSYSDVNDLLSRLSGDERIVAAALKNGERLVDDVIAETGLSTGKILAVLTMLELKGVIRRLPGKRIILK